VINTCSVTVQAAGKSRQSVRQAARGRKSEVRSRDSDLTSALPPNRRIIVTGCWATSDRAEALEFPGVSAVLGHQDDVARELERLLSLWDSEDLFEPEPQSRRQTPPAKTTERHQTACALPPESLQDDGWTMQAGTPAKLAGKSKAHNTPGVKKKVAEKEGSGFGVQGSDQGTGFRVRGSGADPASFLNPEPRTPNPAAEPRTLNPPGTWSLPVLSGRQSGHQRAFLKVQDGCDAHCTYCIIPKLRPNLRSKGIGEVVEEAKALVAAGHVELVLTGIFLGAYGRTTAVRRPSSVEGSGFRVQGSEKASALNPEPRTPNPQLAGLAEALCTRVPGLRRLRFSSLEPGDLDEQLVAALRGHPQVVPHFHLPLQSGSDALLRRMNRQYRREDYVRMVQRVREAFDRPALTTDIIVGFPGETDEEFQQTLEVVDACRFIHIHAFPFSPRPGTAAARWQKDRGGVRGPVVNQRMEMLRQRALGFSYEYRRQFLGQTVELLVEKPSAADEEVGSGRLAEEGVGSRQLAVGSGNSTANCQPPTANYTALLQHGRCERYFSVFFEADRPMTGQSVRVRIERVTPARTMGRLE
jgi:MiaB/RimO family radical SAM methylthiotransferase